MFIFVLLLNLVNLALMAMLVIGFFTSLIQLNPLLIVVAATSMLLTDLFNGRILRNAQQSGDVR